MRDNITNRMVGTATGKRLKEVVERQVNKEVERLNKINEGNKYIVKVANAQRKKTENDYKQCMKKVMCQHEDIFIKVLKPYYEQMKQLVANLDFININSKALDLDNILDNIKEITYTDYSQETYNAHSLIEILRSAFLTFVKVEGRINKAKEERIRLRTKKVEIDLSCIMVRKKFFLLESTYEVVERLKVEAEKYIDMLKEMNLRKERCCSDFSEQDINMLKNSINLIVLLNQIVNPNTNKIFMSLGFSEMTGTTCDFNSETGFAYNDSNILKNIENKWIDKKLKRLNCQLTFEQYKRAKKIICRVKKERKQYEINTKELLKRIEVALEKKNSRLYEETIKSLYQCYGIDVAISSNDEMMKFLQSANGSLTLGDFVHVSY